jgi:hypothetical protein
VIQAPCTRYDGNGQQLFIAEVAGRFAFCHLIKGGEVEASDHVPVSWLEVLTFDTPPVPRRRRTAGQGTFAF